MELTCLISRPVPVYAYGLRPSFSRRLAMQHPRTPTSRPISSPPLLLSPLPMSLLPSPLPSSHSNHSPDSQQLQTPRNLIDHTFRPRPHPQHSRRPTGNLRPARIMNNPCTQPQTHRLSLKLHQFIFRVRLHGNLCLAEGGPAFEQRMGGRGVQEGGVAC